MSRLNEIKKQNPRLDVSLIEVIASLDPTPTYKYLSFFIKLLKREIGDRDVKETMSEILFDDYVVDLIKKFESHSKAGRIKNPDISDYNSMGTIENEVRIADSIYNQKEAEKLVVKYYDSVEFIVLTPLSFEASKMYGAGTKWCTTQQEHWNNYSDSYKLIYIIDKLHNKKYAVSKKYDEVEIKAWLADDTETSPLLLDLPGPVFEVLCNELRKSNCKNDISSICPVAESELSLERLEGIRDLARRYNSV